MDAPVMAGLDPAIQTPKTRVWMPGSIPGLDPGTGMTVRVTNNEIWYRVLNRRGLILAGLSFVIPTRLDAAAMIASWEGKNLVLTPGPARAVLRLSGNMTVANLAAQAQTRRIILRLGGIAANRDPETGYFVFLNAGDDVKPTADDIGYAGALSFFGIRKELREGARAVSFEVAPVLVRLRQAGRLNGPISVTILPATPPAVGSGPSIAEIALYGN